MWQGWPVTVEPPDVGSGDRPLEGVRVLDLTRFVSGPHATRLLADLGADVVKVEPPAGDGTRRWGRRVGDVGPYFSQQNCGKRSIVVDLRTPRGVEVCRRLAAVADVFVENFRPGVADRLGLGAGTLRAANPRLVYASVSGFGPEGDMADRRAYANVVHAAVGLLERQGRYLGTGPVPIRWSAADTTSALHLAVGILAALVRRDRTGAGDVVRVAMFDATLASDDFAAFDLWDPDPDAPRPDPVLLRTADGWVMVSANPVLEPGPFLEAVGRPGLASVPPWHDRRARREHRSVLIADLEAVTSRWPTGEVERAFHEAGLAVARVRSTTGAVAWARTQPRPVIVDVDDRRGGTVPLINSPQRFGEAAAGVSGTVPALGEHTAEVLGGWLGLDPSEAAGEAERIGGPRRPPEPPGP